MSHLHKNFSGIGMVIALLIMTGMFSASAQEADINLADKVRAALSTQYMQDFTVKEPNEGTVEIEGEVSSMYDKYRVFEIAARVNGVKKVITNVIVDTEILPDAVIRDNIRDELQLVSSIKEPENIEIKVDDGVVMLSGTVNFYREKVMAKTVASWQEGVRGIVNNIEVLPLMKAMSDRNITDILESIMEDDFPTEDNIEFTVEQGEVTLKGKTSDLWAKHEIEDRFSNIMGVISVDNNIRIID